VGAKNMKNTGNYSAENMLQTPNNNLPSNKVKEGSKEMLKVNNNLVSK